MKYRLSPREIPRVEAKGFPEGSGDISSYNLSRVTIQSFSITSSRGPLLANIFSYWLRKLAIFSSIGFVSLQYFPILLV